MKRLLLALAVLALFLTTAALPSMADGNPETKPTICSILGCIKPL